MPDALKFTIGGSSDPFERSLARADQLAAKYSRNITNSIEKSFKIGAPNLESTVFSSTKSRDAAQEYVDFWHKAFREREQAEVQSAIRSAERSNKARALLRERAAEREAALPMQGPDLSGRLREREEDEVQSAVRAAERSNKARALLRERAAEREAALPMQGPDLSGRLREREEDEVQSAVRAAERSNKARALLRKRAAEREAAMIGDWQGPVRQAYDQARPSGFIVGGIAGSSGGGRFGNLGGRLGVAGSMFTSVARDSAASLASGAPITQVIAQQAPQVLQALSMMRLGMVGIGLAAAGVASIIAFKMVKSLTDSYFLTQKIADGMVRIGVLTDRLALKTKTRLSATVLQYEAELDAAQAGERALKQEEDAADAAADLAKEKIKANYIANNSVKTKENELALEKKLLAVDLERAKAKLEAAKKDANGVSVAEAKLKLAQMEEAALKTQAADKAELDKVKNAPSLVGFFGGAPDAAARIKQLNDIAQAVQKMDENDTKIRQDRAKAQADVREAENSPKQAAINRAEAELRRVENQMGMMGLIDGQASRLSGRGSSPSVTDRQRIGGMAVGDSPLVDIGRQQVRWLQSIDRKIAASGSINQHFGGK